MQYEAIRDERRMAANTATRIGDAFLSLLSFGQSFLDVFLRKDVDDTAKGRITFNNGAVNKGIVVFSEDGTFAEGLTGHGGRICPDGSAELDSLTLRRFRAAASSVPSRLPPTPRARPSSISKRGR